MLRYPCEHLFIPPMRLWVSDPDILLRTVCSFFNFDFASGIVYGRWSDNENGAGVPKQANMKDLLGNVVQIGGLHMSGKSTTSKSVRAPPQEAPHQRWIAQSCALFIFFPQHRRWENIGIVRCAGPALWRPTEEHCDLPKQGPWCATFTKICVNGPTSTGASTFNLAPIKHNVQTGLMQLVSLLIIDQYGTNWQIWLTQKNERHMGCKSPHFTPFENVAQYGSLKLQDVLYYLGLGMFFSTY